MKVWDNHLFYIACTSTLSVTRGKHKQKTNVVACFIYFNREGRHTVDATDEYRNNRQGADKREMELMTRIHLLMVQVEKLEN